MSPLHLLQSVQPHGASDQELAQGKSGQRNHQETNGEVEYLVCIMGDCSLETGSISGKTHTVIINWVATACLLLTSHTSLMKENCSGLSHCNWTFSDLVPRKNTSTSCRSS